MKTCPRCHLLRSEFYPDNTKKDNLGTYCIPCTSERAREYYRGQGWKIHLLCAARTRAKQKKVPFAITPEDIEIPEFCPILGVRLTVSPHRGAGSDSASLDRINPALGYVPGNIQVISMLANRMKSDATAEDMRKFAAWVAKTFPDSPRG